MSQYALSIMPSHGRVILIYVEKPKPMRSLPRTNPAAERNGISPLIQRYLRQRTMEAVVVSLRGPIENSQRISHAGMLSSDFI